MNVEEKDYYLIMRKRKKITQIQVAQGMGISQAFVSYFECNKWIFTDEQFKKYKVYIETYKN
ncbi:helix-turn-helix domain-containing protein [Viridibacillus arvi]|uniref:helix-turn-helix domain-containing protein n=1 Tax=Viridibacillus arvi TaxID=263475 RepID=UPI003D2B0FB5